MSTVVGYTLILCLYLVLWWPETEEEYEARIFHATEYYR